MNIEDILAPGRNISEIIADLSVKSIELPAWAGKRGLEAQYNPDKHPVMDKSRYHDIVEGNGEVDYVSRITYDLQRLAVNRMGELLFGIPVKRIYRATNDTQNQIAADLEAIFARNRIDSFNLERAKMLFAGCEVITLWYPDMTKTDIYGFTAPFKLRCANYSPMLGDRLYPLFDEMGDLVALSIAYDRKVGSRRMSFFDAYTATKHYKWSTVGGTWLEVENDDIPVGKIPAVYTYRPTPIWEDTSKIVYEMEWAMSRAGNYLRKNSKPMVGVFADEVVNYGDELGENREFRSIIQLPANGRMEYVTWNQQTESLKFFINTLRESFFTQLQLPDWSYEKMSQQALSGESRKQLFIDAQLKVKEESGRWLELFDREINVVKAFYKIMRPDISAKEVDALQVECQITPFTINDAKEQTELALLRNGNKPLQSQRESIEVLGISNDVDKTMDEIRQEAMADAAELSL